MLNRTEIKATIQKIMSAEHNRIKFKYGRRHFCSSGKCGMCGVLRLTTKQRFVVNKQCLFANMAFYSQTASLKLCFHYHIYHYSTKFHPRINSAPSFNIRNVFYVLISNKSAASWLISHLTFIQKRIFSSRKRIHFCTTFCVFL